MLFGETGEKTIRRVSEGALMSTVNLAEVLQLLPDSAPIEEGLADVGSLGIELIPFSAEHAASAADMRAATDRFGLSLADRACLALALERGAVAITGDRAWDEVDVGVEVMQFR